MVIELMVRNICRNLPSIVCLPDQLVAALVPDYAAGPRRNVYSSGEPSDMAKEAK